ncbi:uncharacterized protein LOC132729097 [Ruditapes philippinarum]|uniref:uncharacterized protein LOC132729097 n=1 Tax=Ruditapes philippinarum TaxID=129788 RepID=UPI00295B25E5|nr:uncharacterized protein LOC132729097 [Ruditapes philippinarum]
MAPSAGNANKSLEMNAVEGKGNLRLEFNSRLTELKNLLPEGSSSQPCQTQNDILLEVINYIKWLQTECSQSQEIQNQLKRLFVDLIKSAVTLKRLKDLTKATVVDKSTDGKQNTTTSCAYTE